jgi:putative endonuclease
MFTMSAWFYILRLQSGKLYPGATRRPPEARYKEHLDGNGCRTTQIDPPECLAYSEEHEDYTAALQREHQIKRWSHAKKEALVNGDLARLKQLSKRRT